MSGETAKAESGWTVDTLKEHLEQRFTDQEKAVNAALVAAKQAVEKEEANSEKWRQSANEWRGSMLDRETKFASRGEVDAKYETLAAQIASLKESRAEGIGSRTMILMLFGLISAAATLIAIFFALRGR